MASPQKENGFTPISNELLEAVYRTSFTSTELKMIIFIMRFTYGYSRKENQLSLSFISNGIGVSKRYTSEAIKKLIADNVIKVVKEHTDTQSRIIQINKNYDKWMNRTTVIQMNHSSTVEAEDNTTDEPQFNTTDELQFNQEKKTIKKTLKQDAPHSQKHKYGEYQHVLLTDDEKDRLISEYGEDIFNRCIKKLDEYIEVKKPKYNNHNLVIRKWVIKAVQEDGNKLPDNMNRTEKAALPATTEPEEEPIDLWSD